MVDSNSLFFEKIIGRSEKAFLNEVDLESYFSNSRILVTGAAGSIGSAIIKRLTKAGIRNVYLLDHDESALHNLILQLSQSSDLSSKNCFNADIRDLTGIQEVIHQIEPSVVIHTAALKHLVTLERFPREGFLSNVVGTLNIAEACREFGMEQFINISTDKAARPISVLGKTKKLGELITEEIFVNTKTKYCSVRFGNVFASRGSVIETFIHQIKYGIPVTLSDMDVGRFFMSENEAANLVLAASTLDVGGTYIQDMGEEVKIINVIERMFEYFQSRVGINLIGLHPGEKLHEELYDGPVSVTKFPSIFRSEHSISKGLVEAIKQVTTANNIDARHSLDSLIQNFLKL
jgi:FlaA1/EpsC-like NDP-sugar epimerase